MPSRNCFIRNGLQNKNIEVYIKKRGEHRHGAFPGGQSRLNPNTTAEIVGYSGEPDIALIIVSELVPGSGKNKNTGLHINFSKDMNPKSTEMRMDSDKKYEFEYYFKNIKLTDDENEDDEEESIDVDVKHPAE